MRERAQALRARLQEDGHFKRVMMFMATGGLSTVLGGLILTIEIEKLGLEQNRANYVQAFLLFVLFYPVYRRFVFNGGSAELGLSMGRWFIVKSSAALVVEPAAFFLLAHFHAPPLGSFLFGSAVSGAYSYLAGHWAFGVRWTKAE